MTNELVLVGFYFLTLVYSIIIHEVSHGWMAMWLGDLTAKYADRLNLNPLKHIDPIGSIVVPIVMTLTTGYAFGWAKPVPYNPYNLRNQKWGPALVAFAGPLSNITLAIAAIIVSRLLPIDFLERMYLLGKFKVLLNSGGDFFSRWGSFADALAGSVPHVIFGLCLLVVFWNILLAFFNLLPLPPLDGSKIMYAVFSFRQETILFLERYGLTFVIVVLFVLPLIGIGFFSSLVSIILGASLQFFFGLMV